MHIISVKLFIFTLLCSLESKDQIDMLIDDQNFDDVFEELSETLEQSQKNSYYADAAIFLYNKYIMKLNRKYVQYSLLFPGISLVLIWSKLINCTETVAPFASATLTLS